MGIQLLQLMMNIIIINYLILSFVFVGKIAEKLNSSYRARAHFLKQITYFRLEDNYYCQSTYLENAGQNKLDTGKLEQSGEHKNSKTNPDADNKRARFSAAEESDSEAEKHGQKKNVDSIEKAEIHKRILSKRKEWGYIIYKRICRNFKQSKHLYTSGI